MMKGMKKVKITSVKQVIHQDLIDRYENPISEPCTMEVGQMYICENLEKPDGFCESAWKTLYPFVMVLAYGGKDIYSGWMKNENSAMISCNDGFRPMSFLLEGIDE